MSYFVVDVEADGPFPPEYSMVCFGAVKVADLSNTYYGTTFPISDKWDPNALAVSGFSREQHLTFTDAQTTMKAFDSWLANDSGRPVLISDNNMFDGMWMNYYFHYYLGRNPFGFSSRRIGDLYSGMMIWMPERIPSGKGNIVKPLIPTIL